MTGGDAEEETNIKHDNKSQEKKHCKKATSQLQSDFWTTEDRKSSL